MAKGSTGKRVARAAATGGSRTRKGEAPLGFYTSLALIIVIGIFVVGYSRYERLHPSGAAGSPPRVGQTWHVAFGVYDCNAFLPNLKAQKNTSSLSFYTTGNGLITVQPRSALNEGSNATLGKFVLGYSGLYLSGGKIFYPGHAAITSSSTCNGKPATIQVKVWSSLLSAGKVYTGNPANIRFADQQLISVGLVAKGSSLPKPDSTKALVNLGLTQALSSTTTTVPSLSPATTVPSPTTSTAAG
ncbi:MAG: hypothetical protein M0Z34_05860 [Nitrospiraceae bacterium]|nr:hypothetical protein [Nitrospiraceae bacterium]MDA8262058.1 hypothetical protein [Actinomycetota bacterium]